MILLSDISPVPMVVYLIVPVAALMLFVAFLVWESRLPPERRVMHRLRMARKHNDLKHKLH
jgi:hypothetical protein